MQRDTLARLGVAAALLVGAALGVKWWAQAPQDAATALPRLWPEQTLQTMDRLLIRDAKGAELRIEKSGEQWLLSNRLDQPVAMSALRALADALRDARVTEAKTAQAAQHDKLGIADNGADMRRLTISAGDKLLADLVLGKTAAAGGGQFVRLATDAQVWQLDRAVPASAQVSDWLQRDLIDWPAARMRVVERVQDKNVRCVMAPCPQEWSVQFTLRKAEAASEWSLSPIPAGRQALAAWQLSGLAEALAGLQLDDLRSDEGVDMSTALSTRFQRDDGLVVWVSALELDGQTWLRLRADGIDEAAQKVAGAENARWSGKLFQVSSWKGEALRKTLEQLTEALPKAAPKAAPKAESPKDAANPVPEKKP